MIQKLIGTIAKITSLRKKISANTSGFSLNVGKSVSVLLPHRSVTYQSNGRSMRASEFYSFRWRKAERHIRLDPTHEPNPHILITGMSGFGKSTLFKSMLMDIRSHNIPAIIFDAHNEHSAIVSQLNGKVHDAAYTGINILELDGASVAERISELTRLFRSVYSLGYIQALKLSECLWYTYRKLGARSKTDRSIANAPVIKDLVSELNIFIMNARTATEKSTLQHLRDRISLLNTRAFGSDSLKVSDLKTGINLFSLAGMRSSEMQFIYISELLGRLYAQMKGNAKESGIKCYVMLDEAQFLMDETSGSSEMIGRLIEEGRKYGVGVLIVSHASSTLNRQIIANAATYIAFYSREPNEVLYSSKVLSGGDNGRAEAIRARMRSLRQNEAIMISGSMRDPVLVSTPRYDALPVVEMAAASVDGALAHAIRPISKSEIEALLSHDQINALLAEGRLDEFTVNTNGADETFYMRRNNSLSIEHEVYVTKISELLTAKGIRNKIVDNSSGPDVVAYTNGKKIAIEYETGKKDLRDTIKMLASREKGFDEIMVIVNDEAFKRYQDGILSQNSVLLRSSGIGSLPKAIIK